MPPLTRPDPYENDPGHWGASLVNVAEILIPCLDAIEARSVAEVGSYAGDLTRMLLDWSAESGARVVAIDPTPEPQLAELAEQRSDLELIRETSHEALRHLSLPDAVIIDGDHNYYTVSEELRLIGEKAPGAEIPLLMFHDVGWPHARRDTYFDPERIPEEHRHPLVQRAGLFPGDPGLVEGALPFHCAAEREGGPRNGVLTAIEDFVATRNDLRLAALPPFFGFGIVWHRDAPWADAIGEIVEPWEHNPVLEGLEENRVYHLATVHIRSVELWNEQRSHYTTYKELERLRDLNSKQEHLLKAMLASRGLALADRMASLRHPRRPASWREQVRDALGENTGDSGTA